MYSMGAVGVCWDNAVAESFFSHLKTPHRLMLHAWATCEGPHMLN